MERTDAVCCKQRRNNKEKTRTVPDHRHGTVLENEGTGRQAGGSQLPINGFSQQFHLHFLIGHGPAHLCDRRCSVYLNQRP
jgi:hypothetical protein